VHLLITKYFKGAGRGLGDVSFNGIKSLIDLFCLYLFYLLLNHMAIMAFLTRNRHYVVEVKRSSL